MLRRIVLGLGLLAACVSPYNEADSQHYVSSSSIKKRFKFSSHGDIKSFSIADKTNTESRVEAGTETLRFGFSQVARIEDGFYFLTRNEFDVNTAATFGDYQLRGKAVLDVRVGSETTGSFSGTMRYFGEWNPYVSAGFNTQDGGFIAAGIWKKLPKGFTLETELTEKLGNTHDGVHTTLDIEASLPRILGAKVSLGYRIFDDSGPLFKASWDFEEIGRGIKDLFNK